MILSLEHKAKATKRLEVMADKYDATLPELLAWYADPNDMKSISEWTREQVEESVRFYIYCRANDPRIQVQARKANSVKSQN